MGSPFSGYKTLAHLEHDAVLMSWFVAIDGSSNVVGYLQTTPGASPTAASSLIKGAGRSLGPQGAIILQPHTATGTYLFTLDEPWICLLNSDFMAIDQGAVGSLTPSFDANVSNQTTGIGALPGNNSALSPMTVRLRLRNNAGALTDPVASTGFWVQLLLKRTGIG